MAEPTPRKAGRPRRGPQVQKYTVMLPPWLHEWAMQHPEGFTGLVRRLLLEEHSICTDISRKKDIEKSYNSR